MIFYIILFAAFIFCSSSDSFFLLLLLFECYVLHLQFYPVFDFDFISSFDKIVKVHLKCAYVSVIKINEHKMFDVALEQY